MRARGWPRLVVLMFGLLFTGGACWGCVASTWDNEYVWCPTDIGIEWTKYNCDSGKTWQEATDFCEEKGLRLPTKEEALAIAESGSFCGFDTWYTWTSTAAGSGQAWYVFNYGSAYENDVGISYSYVLCVR